MTTLPEILKKIDAWLAKHRKRMHDALHPGATPRELDALQSEVGESLPEEMRTLLAWHNGQSVDVPGGLEEDWRLLGTEQVAKAKKELDGELVPGWNHDWLPVLHDGQGNYLVLDPTGSGVPLLDCWQGRAEHDRIADSLTKWAAHFLEGLESGAYTEDPERGGFYRAGS
jgi:cell wall assembly regulator SMI1